MPPVIVTCEHNSDEWWAMHLGKPSASSMNKIITSTGRFSQQRTGYLNKLAAERVSGQVQESFGSNHWTREGHRLEPEACQYYAMITSREVLRNRVVFQNEDLDFMCSPDGLIGEDGGLEIKCPKASTQVEYLKARRIPSAYKVQVQASLWITGRSWWDFFSYCEGMPPLMVRANRDEGLISRISAGVRLFLEDLEDTCSDIGGTRTKGNL